MKERIVIFITLIVIVAVLIGLNAASYIRVEQEADLEKGAKRSTYNAGATGTLAFFDFLRETGRNSIRWQERADALLKNNPDGFSKDNAKQSSNVVSTLVVIGPIPIGFDDKERENLFRWVERGGHLVIIDRDPNEQLLANKGLWEIKVHTGLSPDWNTNPENTVEMTNGVKAEAPAQPTVLTADVNAVMPSRFASAIEFGLWKTKDKNAPLVINGDDPPPTPKPASTPPEKDVFFEPTPKIKDENDFDDEKIPIYSEKTEAELNAPVVHLTNNGRPILIDYAYGKGRVMLLTDPYIVSNKGIELADNLRLATNLVTAGGGTIAFDEYHHGYGATGNQFYNYFAGTPVPTIVAQFGLIVLLLVWTRGRRFARPLPLPNPDRRSKLEYVAAMAELQRRTRANDLAIENIYNRVRRNLARFVGTDNMTTSTKRLAELVAERSKLNAMDLWKVLHQCEEIIHGEKVNDKTALDLAARLREIEQRLGITKRANHQSK
jgi:hypothetical protein